MSDPNQGRIFLAVAMPKQFVFAPFELAIGNIMVSVLFMVFLIGAFRMTPFPSIIPLVGGHLLLIVLGNKNPHLTTTIFAMLKYPTRKKNRIGVKMGTKYIP